MAKENIAAIVDIGSAETKVLIVELFPRLNIIGSCVGTTRGMRKCEILDMNELKESVHAAIHDAEESAGTNVKVHCACISLSGMDLNGSQVTGLTSVKSDSSVVCADDIATARSDAYARRVPAGRTIVHRLRQTFLLDSRVAGDNPEGRIGHELAYKMWVVDSDIAYLSELIQIPNQYGMRVEEVFLSSLASASAVETGSAVDNNRLVIDIGAGTSDYILYQDGIVQKTGVIPVGGVHITNDLASALRINDADAERMKIKYGNAVLHDEDVFGEIDLDSVDGELSDFSPRVSKFKLNYVIALRVREIFELIRKDIGDGTSLSSVFVTGGTAQLPGLIDVAGEIFDSEARLVEPTCSFACKFSEPRYSTVVGMANLLFRRRMAERRYHASRSLITRIKNIFLSK